MTDETDPKPSDADRPEWAKAHGPLRSFGRIKSRPIKAKQAALFDTLMPRIAVPDPAQGPIDPLALMLDAKAAWLVIGFRGGEQLAAQSAWSPAEGSTDCAPLLITVAS